MTDKIKVRVKEGYDHRITPPEGRDPQNPTGKPGPLAIGGDIIEVTEQELRDFGDKFEPLDGVETTEDAPRRGRPKKAEDA